MAHGNWAGGKGCGETQACERLLGLRFELGARSGRGYCSQENAICFHAPHPGGDHGGWFSLMGLPVQEDSRPVTSSPASSSSHGRGTRSVGAAAAHGPLKSTGRSRELNTGLSDPKSQAQ